MAAAIAAPVSAPFGTGWWRPDAAHSAAPPVRIELRLAIRDRARFLSHLEMVDLLLAAFRRAGYEISLSNGLRPRPVISLALARGVGVASEDEHCTIELVGDSHDLDELIERLAATQDLVVGQGWSMVALCRSNELANWRAESSVDNG